MSEGDLFREVQEDLRREQLARLWNKYGVVIIATAVCIVLFVGVYNGYRWYQAKRAMENGAAFYAASVLLDENKTAEAREALTRLSSDGPGSYRALAKFELAAAHAKEGRPGDAVKLYDELAQDGGADAILKDFAKVQGATLRLDEADPAEIAKRLDKIDADSNPWRYSARELLALSAFRSGNTAESEKLFNRILSDPFAPAEIRKRAESMLALLVKSSAPANSQAGTPKDAATQ